MRKEILRYLGYKEKTMGQVESWIEDAIDEIINLLSKTCRPRNICKVIDIKVCQGMKIDFGGLFIVESEKLAYNLKDCEKAVVMGATLGSEVDMMISRYSRRDMSKAVIVEAAATALIEEYCDNIQEELSDEFGKEGIYLRPRFSPGYGDFNISHQKDVLDFLECQKKIGLTMTDGFMLAPTKSVTAVIGLSKNDERCSVKGCEACEKKDCEYRRNR